jgi:hypothetical protein
MPSLTVRTLRLGCMLTFEVGQADLTAEWLHRQLLGSAGATRKDLERVGEVILQEAMIGKKSDASA